jgi:hypothetical protein
MAVKHIDDPPLPQLDQENTIAHSRTLGCDQTPDFAVDKEIASVLQWDA